MNALRHYWLGIRYRVIEQPLWRALERLRPRHTEPDRLAARVSGGSLEALGATVRDRLRLDFFGGSADVQRVLESVTESERARILQGADEVARHQFDFLGSGLTDLGAEIDWHSDFRSGRRWEPRFSRDIDYTNLDSPSDVKVAWELSRFHYLTSLGLAYGLTRDEKYVHVARRLIDSWIESNPFYRGINWSVAMEVSIRAANWIQGLGLMAGSPALDDRFLGRVAASLFDHGRAIRFGLEYAKLSNNHYLSNGTGLALIGWLFRDLPTGRRWWRLGQSILEDEIRRQVEHDGVTFEKTISYHRLVLELLYTPYVVLSRRGVAWSADFSGRLERMCEFVLAYTRPDGSVPLLGDADNGRLFRWDMHDDFNDHRDALAVGGILFNRSDFAVAGGRRLHAELLLGPRLASRHDGAAVSDSVYFRHGGIAVIRSAESHMLVDVGDVGLRGKGGHGHQDTLGFELWAAGQVFLADSGTWCYTSDPDAYLAFAATRSHNAVMVDGQEIAPVIRMWLLDDSTRPEVHEWTDDDAITTLRARHFGYTRLPDPVVHERRIVFDRRPVRWTIDDRLVASDRHTVELFLNVHPDVDVIRSDEGEFLLVGDRARLKVTVDGAAVVEDSWYAPTYGVRRPARRLIVRKEGKGIAFRTVLQLEPRVPDGRATAG